jgi:lipoprotein-anchoring transpeptidase ErfK/SrfK
VNRTGVFLSLLAACVVAGVLAAFALAETVPPPGTTATTGTTTTTATTATTTTTTLPGILPNGVTIGGVSVGGLTPSDATTVVQGSFDRPVVLRYGRTTILIEPALLGATAGVDRAVARAAVAAPGTAVPLVVGIRRSNISSFVAKVVHRFTRDPVDARLFLRNLTPVITEAEPGRTFTLRPITDAIVEHLVENTRAPIRLKATLHPPEIADSSFGSVIVIRRGSNRLYLYAQTKLRRVFGVATGQSAYPTPLGRFSIVVKWRDPWWYPPASPWAKGLKPIPPGPGNPLGTRWMGLSASGVGIHGTPDSASIGYSASHGCIRMLISDAEWLFNHVDVGTTVFVVSA